MGNLCWSYLPPVLPGLELSKCFPFPLQVLSNLDICLVFSPLTAFLDSKPDR